MTGGLNSVNKGIIVSSSYLASTSTGDLDLQCWWFGKQYFVPSDIEDTAVSLYPFLHTQTQESLVLGWDSLTIGVSQSSCHAKCANLVHYPLNFQFCALLFDDDISLFEIRSLFTTFY